QVLNTANGKPVGPRLEPKDGFSLTAGAFEPNGPRVVTADADGQIEVWNPRTGQLVRAFGSEGAASINDVQFSPSGNALVTVSDSGQLILWTTAGWKQAWSRNACQTPATARFSHHGGRIVVACGDGSVAVFTRSGQPLVSLREA